MAAAVCLAVAGPIPHLGSGQENSWNFRISTVPGERLLFFLRYTSYVVEAD